MDTKTFSNPISPKDIKITDPFWARYMELARTEVIPYQWEALNDRLPDTAVYFRIATASNGWKLWPIPLCPIPTPSWKKRPMK